VRKAKDARLGKDPGSNQSADSRKRLRLKRHDGGQVRAGTAHWNEKATRSLSEKRQKAKERSAKASEVNARSGGHWEKI